MATTPSQIPNTYPSSFFSIYTLEIAKFFKDRFSAFTITRPTQQIPNPPAYKLQVFYGTPKAAFRDQYATNNGKVILPLLSFLLGATNRKTEMEHRTSMLTTDIITTPEGKKMRYASRAPMHFELTYQFTLFNNNLRERDVMLHKIHQAFVQGEMMLTYYPDPNNTKDFLFMPLKLDAQSFNDETSYDELDSKDVHDQIKTSFNIIADALLPYETYEPYLNEFVDTESINKLINDPLYKKTYTV